MFRNQTAHQKFFALLLPAILLWSWMACVFVCSDIAKHNSDTQAKWTANLSNEAECLNENSSLDNCPFTSTPATVQERQTISLYAVINEEIAFISFKHLVSIPMSIVESDINQNSPPKLTSQLFIRLCNFLLACAP